MPTETCIVLPDAETMMARLKVISDDSHIVQRFYPLLTKNAGEERVPMGIVMMLQLAIYDYCKGMPPMMAAILTVNMEHYINALVPDETAASEVKASWTKVLEKTKAG